MSIFDQATALLDEILLFTSDLKRAFNDKGLRESELKGFRSLLLCALDQSERYANAILLLCENKLSAEASPLLRTFFEFVISMKLLDSDRDLTRRFAAFSWVRLKELTRYGKPAAGGAGLAGMPQSLSPEEIEDGFQRAKKEFNFTSRESWFPPTRPDRDPNLRDICIRLGEQKTYDKVYRRLSDLSHANIMSLSPYDLRRAEGKITFARAEQPSGDEAAIAASLSLDILSLFDREFGLGLSSPLEDFSKRLQGMIEIR